MKELEASRALLKACPTLTAMDARFIVDRIIHLSDAGECAVSIMNRLNPPAELPRASSEVVESRKHWQINRAPESLAESLRRRGIRP